MHWLRSRAPRCRRRSGPRSWSTRSCWRSPASATPARTSAARSLADEPYGVYFGENWISVDPSVDYDKTRGAVEDTVDGYPGLYRDVLTYLKERIREVLTGTSDTIVVRISGQDLDLLRQKATEVNELLGQVAGGHREPRRVPGHRPADRGEGGPPGRPQNGVKPGDVRRAAAWMMAGEEAGDIYRGGRAYDVQVWSAPETRAERERPARTS